MIALLFALFLAPWEPGPYDTSPVVEAIRNDMAVSVSNLNTSTAILNAATSNLTQASILRDISIVTNSSKYVYVFKYGANHDVDTGTTPEDIWSYGGLYTFTTNGGAHYQMSSSSHADSNTITIYGIASDYSYTNYNAVLQGTNIVPAGTNRMWRAFRAFNAGSVTNNGNVYIYESNAGVAAGVPTSNVRVLIEPDAQQTEMAIYTIPSNYNGYMLSMYGNVNYGTTAGTKEADVEFYVRQFGGVFRVGGRSGMGSDGTQSFKYKFDLPYHLPAMSDIVMRVHGVSANNTAIVGFFELLLVKIQ